MQIDTLSQINEVINSLVKKGNFKQANNLNQLFLKMAQAAPNAGGAPAAPGGPAPTSAPANTGQGQTQNGSNQAKAVDPDMMDIIKQFLALKEYANKQTPPAFYSFSRGNFTVSTPDNKTISSTSVGDLFSKLGVTNQEIKEISEDMKPKANAIISAISSAKSWKGASPEASKAINDKYDLGYNFEEEKYYIADPNNSADIELRLNVTELEEVYNQLGNYYKANKSLPASLAGRNTLPSGEQTENQGSLNGDLRRAPKSPGTPTDVTPSAAQIQNAITA